MTNDMRWTEVWPPAIKAETSTRAARPKPAGMGRPRDAIGPIKVTSLRQYLDGEILGFVGISSHMLKPLLTARGHAPVRIGLPEYDRCVACPSPPPFPFSRSWRRQVSPRRLRLRLPRLAHRQIRPLRASICPSVSTTR